MGSAQTMKSWAVAIKSYEDVPRAFRDQFTAFSNKETVFPYTVFAPPYKSLHNKIIGKMLYVLDDRIVVLEKVKTDITSAVYYLKDINYFTAGRDLLYSWLKVEGISNGELRTSVIEYDSVVNDIFAPVMEKVRISGNEFGESDLQTERKKFDDLCSLNYKFMNYGKGSIHQGERVMHMVLQNRIRVILVDLRVTKFYKTLTNAHMSILTDKEVILIKETNHRGPNYGHTWTYVPLHRIEEFSTSRDDKNNLLISTWRLKNNGKLDSIFELSAKPELDTLLSNFNNLR